MTKLLQGENRLLTRQLTLADKTTALPVASIEHLSVVLSQKGQTVATYTLGSSPQLRASGAAEVVLEITTALSATLSQGPVREIWTLRQPNAAFVAEPGTQVDRIVLDDIEIV